MCRNSSIWRAQVGNKGRAEHCTVDGLIVWLAPRVPTKDMLCKCALHAAGTSPCSVQSGTSAAHKV